MLFLCMHLVDKLSIIGVCTYDYPCNLALSVLGLNLIKNKNEF